MKKFFSVSLIAMSALVFGFTSNSVAAPERFICGDVTFSCGKTGRICGHDVQGLIDRYNEADSQVCTESIQ